MEKSTKPEKADKADVAKPEASSKQVAAATKPAAKAAKPADDADDDFASVTKAVKGMKQSTAVGDSRAAAKPKQVAAADGRDGESLADQVNKALRSGGAPTAASAASQAASAQAGPVTASEIEGVRRQIEQCWNVPAGLKGTADMVVSIRVEMGIDGRPRSAVIENAARMDSDPSYRATAESAKRAVLNPRCQPFKLPPEKYERWRTLTLVFNPAEMFRT
ncbi:hypothetical protein HQ394_17990 [Defluviicoccus vanus]|uniref:Cell envelope integrity protein TolA n=1 Tax=Defluviicoccus vanus TaxID=111831 RepID=A0A7H1N573_9PROT|nr:hypothetical protein HQ394_17990 [Defluviicoccus vanus]